MNRLLILLLIILTAGQLLRLPISEGGSIVLNDLIVPLVLIVWAANGLAKKRFVIQKSSLNLPLIIFLMIAGFSFLVNLNNLFGFERLQSLAYLLRLLSYSLIFFVVLDTIKSKESFSKFYSLMIWAGLIFAWYRKV